MRLYYPLTPTLPALLSLMNKNENTAELASAATYCRKRRLLLRNGNIKHKKSNP